MARDVNVTITATGNLPINRPTATWGGLGGGSEQEIIAVSTVSFIPLTLDQDILVNLTWKDGFWTRKVQDRFNLRELDEEYRDRLMSQL